MLPRACLLLPLLLLALAQACDDGPSPPSPSPAGAGSPPPSSPGPTPARGPPGLAILGGTLVDGTGAGPVPDAYVLVSDGRIEEAGCCASAVDIPSGYRVIDAGGGTVMPGLGDGHVHATRQIVGEAGELAGLGSSQDGLLPFLQAGFTLLRDVGTSPVVFPPVRYYVDTLTASGKAPRVVWAGPILTAVGGYPLTVPRYAVSGQDVKSADDAVQWVDRLADGGARIIKLGLEKGYYGDEGWALLTLDEIRAISRRAHERGLLVTAHVTSLDELRLAIDGGVDSLAHTPIEPVPEAMMREMVAGGMAIVTTATIWQPGAQEAADNAVRYARAGGTVALGTDFGCCGQVAGIDAYLSELQFLRSAGMTPMQLLEAATRGVALVANAGAESGTVEPGKRADLIVVDGDPLSDLAVLRRVRTVVLGGQIAFEKERPAATPSPTPEPRTQVLVPAQPERSPQEPGECTPGGSNTGFRLVASGGAAEVKQGEPVSMTLQVSACGAAPLTLYFEDSQRYDFVVSEASRAFPGREVWRWSDGKAFAAAADRELRILPGERLSFTEVWDQGDAGGAPVPAGRYEILGVVVGCRDEARRECRFGAASFVQIAP